MFNQNHRVFFNGMEMPQQDRQHPSQKDINYSFNTMILEISSNWKTVRKLMIGVYSENKKRVTQLEGEWANFLIANGINILEHNTEKEFLDKFLRVPL